MLPGLALALLEAEARPQRFLGAALLALAGLARWRRASEDGQRLPVPLLAGPGLRWGPLLLLALSALGLSLGRFALFPPAILALPLCSGSYALLALYQPPALFRRGLPLLLVVLLLVPFQFHLDAMLGFQARQLVARLVQLQLGWLAIPATAVQSVLLFDGGAAHVDLPCNGLRSLWSGALFYVGLSGFRRAHLGLRWLLGLGPQPLRVAEVQRPSDFRVQLLTPHRAEADLLARHGGLLRKWRFVAGPAGSSSFLSGTLLLSISRSFLAQHAPHVCLATAGLQVTGTQRIWLRADLPLAQLRLAGYRGSAVYWFQSSTETTDDVLRRSLPRLLRWQGGADTAREPTPWALVSILFDGPIDSQSPEVRAQLLQLHSAVAATLRGIP